MDFGIENDAESIPEVKKLDNLEYDISLNGGVNPTITSLVESYTAEDGKPSLLVLSYSTCKCYNMANSRKLTTIAVDERNYFVLKNLGRAGDSFNDVLTEVLKKAGAIKE